MAVITLNKEKFEQQVLQAKGPVVVDFWASWCGYCRRLNPVVERLAEQLDGKIMVGKLDIDESPQLAEKYEVDTIPTLILYHNGKVSEPLVNPGSQAAIESWLKDNGAL